jgi:hypothetical protein
MPVSDLYLPQSICLFCWRQKCGPILRIYRSQSHECGNWDGGRAIFVAVQEQLKNTTLFFLSNGDATQSIEIIRSKEGRRPSFYLTGGWVVEPMTMTDKQDRSSLLFLVQGPQLIPWGRCPTVHITQQ